MTARPDKLNDVQTILYEIDLLRYSARKLTEGKWQSKMDEWVHLECFLLHFRNLIEFFGRSAPRADDLHITKPGDIWLNNQKTPAAGVLRRLNEGGAILWKEYEDGDEKKDRISKYLHHCTKSRTESKEWDDATMCRELEKLLIELEGLLPDRHRRWEEQKPVVVLGSESHSTATVTTVPAPFNKP